MFGKKFQVAQDIPATLSRKLSRKSHRTRIHPSSKKKEKEKKVRLLARLEMIKTSNKKKDRETRSRIFSLLSRRNEERRNGFLVRVHAFIVREYKYTYIHTFTYNIYSRKEKRGNEWREQERMQNKQCIICAITHKTPLRLCSHLLRKIRPRVRSRARARARAGNPINFILITASSGIRRLLLFRRR